MNLELLIRGGRYDGQIVKIADNVRQYIIGRSRSCDLRTSRPSVSRRHCALLIDDGQIFVHDLASSNGTYVNGQRIAKSVKLNEGDVVRVGPLEFEVCGSIFGGQSPVEDFTHRPASDDTMDIHNQAVETFDAENADELSLEPQAAEPPPAEGELEVKQPRMQTWKMSLADASLLKSEDDE